PLSTSLFHDTSTPEIYTLSLHDALPIYDFSVDRTRHLNAQQGDANVSLTETIFHLVVNGVSTPDMAFLTDTSYHYTVHDEPDTLDRKSTRLNSSHVKISYAVFCLKKKNK